MTFRHVVKVTGMRGSYLIEVDTDYERNEAHPKVRVTVEECDIETGELLGTRVKSVDFL